VLTVSGGSWRGGLLAVTVGWGLTTRVVHWRKWRPAVWPSATLIAVGLSLLPFTPDSLLTQLHVNDWGLPDRIYHLIKPGILWAGLGTVAGLAGMTRDARILGAAAVLDFLLILPFLAGILTWADVVEALAVLPGLAAGIWVGERSRATAASTSTANQARLVDLVAERHLERNASSGRTPANQRKLGDSADRAHPSSNSAEITDSDRAGFLHSPEPRSRRRVS
jgi:hypothetical protein